MKTRSSSYLNYKIESNSKFNLKRLLFLFFELKNRNNVIYLVGFPNTGYHKLFNHRNVKYFKEDTWITGLLSNSKHINKFIKLSIFNSFLKKKNRVKNFESLKFNSLPDLIVLYERRPYTKYILKECYNLKVPVVILFDNNRDVNMKVFNNAGKDLFTKYIFLLLKSIKKVKGRRLNRSVQSHRRSRSRSS